MIRYAEPEDLPRLVEMAVEGFSTIPRYQGTLVPDAAMLSRYLSDLIVSPIARFFVLGPIGNPYGMMPATIGLHPIVGAMTVSIHLWWVDPRRRGEGLVLLRAALMWGESEGVKVYTVGGSSRALAPIYRRYGFKKLEDVYMRVLK